MKIIMTCVFLLFGSVVLGWLYYVIWMHTYDDRSILWDWFCRAGCLLVPLFFTFLYVLLARMSFEQ